MAPLHVNRKEGTKKGLVDELQVGTFNILENRGNEGGVKMQKGGKKKEENGSFQKIV